MVNKSLTISARPSPTPVKVKATTYVLLRNRIRRVLVSAQREIELQKTTAYWKVGKLIDEHVHGAALAKDHAAYGKQVVQRLSADLEISLSVLYRCLKLTQTYPNLAALPSLSLAHYWELLPVEDPRERALLTDLAVKKNWSSRELERQIQRRAIKDGKSGAAPAKLLLPERKTTAGFKPRRGKLSTYRIAGAKVLKIDLGFSTFVQLPAAQRKKFKDGDIVYVAGAPPRRPRGDVRASARPALDQTPPRFTKKGTKTDLYTYRAFVERVVDADTLWVEIDLGFGVSVRQKLRLRGIDAPELNTLAGKAAKKFVEQQIKKAREITVTTTKPDKYDRYLTDVWLSEAVNLNKLLLQSGYARLKTEVSERDWSLSNWGSF